MARRAREVATPNDIFTIAGGFPPTLNTYDHPADLRPDESPDCYGVGINKSGRLEKNATFPTSGTTRIQKTVTVDTVPYLWKYERLWNITNLTASTASNILTFGAKNYDDIYHPQRNGKIQFTEDANPILALVPIEPDAMFVAKTSGSYVLNNCLDTRAYFLKTGIIQEMGVPAANQVVELDNVIYASNAGGLFAYQSGESVEITQPVRDSLTPFSNVALTADYSKKWILGGATMVYDVAEKKLYRYNGTGFLYTTRQFRLPDYAPINVDRIIFIVEHGTTGDASMSFQVKYDDTDYRLAQEVRIQYTDENWTMLEVPLEDPFSCRRFQMKITDLPTGKYIREIRLSEKAFPRQNYTV